MKTKLALILGIICIAVSAVTLFSVLSHADVVTLAFPDANLSGSVKGVSVLNNDPKFVRLDISPMNFPKAGELSMVFIRFSDEYEASIGREILVNQKMELKSSYYQYFSASKSQPTRRIMAWFVDSEGKVAPYQAPQAVAVDPRNVSVHFENISLEPNLEELVSKRIRDDQLNKGIYVGTYGKMMWVWDGMWTTCGPTVKSSCHQPDPKYPTR